MRRPHNWTTFLVAIAAVVGCSLTRSFDGFTGGSGKKAACALIGWPERPSSGFGGDSTLLGATSEMAFTNPNGASAGRDLDGLCTCGGRDGGDPGACTPRREIVCDAPGGIDNSAADFLTQVIQPTALQAGLQLGLHGLLIKVARWNLRRDDPDVAVSVFNVVGVNVSDTKVAAFDGDDEFVVDEGLTDTGSVEQPKYVDPKAYVSGGVLVAALPRFDLKFAAAPAIEGGDPAVRVTETLVDAHLTGAIEYVEGKGVRLHDAALVGRIPVTTMFSQVGPASSCVDGGGLYGALREKVCPALDLPALPARAGAPSSGPCEALSIGLRVEMVPAALNPSPGTVPFDQPPCPAVDSVCD